MPSQLHYESVAEDVVAMRHPDQAWLWALRHGYDGFYNGRRDRVRVYRNHPPSAEEPHASQTWNKLIFDTRRGYYRYLGRMEADASFALRNILARAGFDYGQNSPLSAVFKSDGATSRKVNDASHPDKQLLSRAKAKARRTGSRARGITFTSPNYCRVARPRSGQATAADGIALIEEVTAGAPPGEEVVAFKFDLPDAYQLCSHCPWNASMYLEIFEGHVFLPCVWCFGAEEAGFHFNRLQFAFCYALTHLDGLSVCAIADDGTVVCLAREAPSAVTKLLQRGRRWGVPFQLKKWRSEGMPPRPLLVFGGVELHCDLLAARHTEKAAAKAAAAAAAVTAAGSRISAALLHKCQGHSNWMASVWAPVRAFTFRIRRSLAVAAHTREGSAPVNLALRRAATALAAMIARRPFVPFPSVVAAKPRLEHTLRQDASDWGAGGHLISGRTIFYWRIQWTAEERASFPKVGTGEGHIGVREFFAATISMRLFLRHRWRVAVGYVIDIQSDNDSSVCGLQALSSRADPFVDAILTEFIHECLDFGVDPSAFSATHLAGERMTADPVSRNDPDSNLQTFLAWADQLGLEPVHVAVPQVIRTAWTRACASCSTR